MKTFKQFVAEAKQIEEQSCALIGWKQIKEFEKLVDRLFEKFGIDFRFTRHFADRMNDDRNNPCITMKEVGALIKKIYQRQGKTIKSVRNAEAVVKDLQTDLNIPIAVSYDPRKDEFDVVMKTIMRKKSFRTTNKTIGYEENELSEEVGTDFLYHNTSYDAFVRIMKSGVLSKTDLVDVAKGISQPKKGYVSLTRDKRYFGAPGASASEVRLVFKRNEIGKRYKLRPKADRSVVHNSRDDLQKTVSGHEARWESEEIALGPIDAKYIERIEIRKVAYRKRLEYLKLWGKQLEKMQDHRDKLKQGYFWHQPKKEFVKIEDYPKVTRERIEKRITAAENSYKEMIKDEKEILSDNRIKTV